MKVSGQGDAKRATWQPPQDAAELFRFVGAEQFDRVAAVAAGTASCIPSRSRRQRGNGTITTPVAPRCPAACRRPCCEHDSPKRQSVAAAWPAVAANFVDRSPIPARRLFPRNRQDPLDERALRMGKEMDPVDRAADMAQQFAPPALGAGGQAVHTGQAWSHVPIAGRLQKRPEWSRRLYCGQARKKS